MTIQLKTIQLIQNGFSYIAKGPGDDLYESLNDFITGLQTGRILPNSYSIRSFEWGPSAQSIILLKDPAIVYFFSDYLQSVRQHVQCDDHRFVYANYHTATFGKFVCQIESHVAATHGYIVPEPPRPIKKRIVELFPTATSDGMLAYTRYKVPEGIIAAPLQNHRSAQALGGNLLLSSEHYRELEPKEEFALRLKYGL
jgi:hypothetical protein